jgi:F-type H+-transporting ATPase subunit epsilon
MGFQFEITTPERTVYRAEADAVTVPTSTGEITILPGHAALVSELAPGGLTVRRGGEETHLLVTGGFVEVRSGSEVVVLADAAERAEEIDLQRAEEARARALAAMEADRKDEQKFTDAAAGLERSLARLRIAKRARHRGHHGVGSEGVLPE